MEMINNSLCKVTILISIILAPFSAFSQKTNTNDFYEQGVRMAKAGKPKQALQIWFDGLSELQEADTIDPRIGLKFIELATTHAAEEFYPAACELYFQALGQKDIQQYKKLFSNEIERMAPILAKAQHEEWQQLLQQGSFELNEKIKKYWIDRDPTPSTETVNERLLEHWKRIAYARKKFKKAKTNVYGTDDRGLIYVQYGEPDIINRGNLGMNRLVYKRWSDTLALLHNASRADEERFIQAVERYNRNPEYVLWIYSTLNPTKPVFYLFGRREGSGSFGLRNGVEDLIPDGAFRRSNTRYTSGILPGAVLQTIYYGELMHLDDFFARRLFELDRAWVGFESQGRSGISTPAFRDLRTRFQLLEKETASLRNVPPERSTFEMDGLQINLVMQPVRLLNETNQPTLAFVALTYPQLDEKYLTNWAEANWQNYQIIHSLRVLDNDQNQVNHFADPIPFNIENASTFSFPHDTSQSEYQFMAEIFDLKTQQRSKIDASTTDPVSVAIGIRGLNIDSDPPLSAAPDSLELSDLVIGTEPPADRPGYHLPFPVTPTNEIEQPDVLKIYFEIYHLLRDENGSAHYTIDYQVARLHGRNKTKKAMISFSYDFDTPQTISKEHFDIDISNLQTGEYELQIEITDQVSTQKKLRTEVFTILEEF